MRILLVEDEVALSSALATILKHNNYSVDQVYNGEDALEYLQTGVYDVVILDVMLPKKDGLSVLKEARSKGCVTPIILLTAKSQTDDKILGLDLGADDYVTKPFESRELLARLRAVTRRKGEGQASVLTFGNTSLDRASFELFTAFSRTRLGNKEYQMMEILMKKPSNVVSTERLMEKIWGYDSDAEMSVVWVYFSSLRKKLAEIGSNLSIKSNRNLGYFLEVKDD